MKLESGDVIEIYYKEFIRQYIPKYELIWGKFIGHDGNGQMIPVDSLSVAEQEKRINFSEFLYTCIESFVCMFEISRENIRINLTNPPEYLTMLNKFIAFQGHAGRIKDNTEDLLLIYFREERVKELMTRLNDTYQQRNTILHGKKLPLSIEDSMVLIATPKGEEESIKEWHSQMNWQNFDSEQMIFLEDYLRNSLEQISQTFNDILSNLEEPIYQIVKDFSIEIDQALTLEVKGKQSEATWKFAVSGTTGVPGFSKSTPYNLGKKDKRKP